MSEMIERVAKAIDPMAFVIPEDDYPAERSRRGAKQFAAMSAAKLAIEAMRSPTEAMYEATDHICERTGDELEIYRAFIDAALE